MLREAAWLQTRARRLSFLPRPQLATAGTWIRYIQGKARHWKAILVTVHKKNQHQHLDPSVDDGQRGTEPCSKQHTTYHRCDLCDHVDNSPAASCRIIFASAPWRAVGICTVRNRHSLPSVHVGVQFAKALGTALSGFNLLRQCMSLDTVRQTHTTADNRNSARQRRNTRLCTANGCTPLTASTQTFRLPGPRHHAYERRNTTFQLDAAKAHRAMRDTFDFRHDG